MGPGRTAQHVKKYGVRRAVGASSPQWERIGDGIALQAQAAIGGGVAVNDFMESVYPYNEIQVCSLSSDGTVIAYLGEREFSWYGDAGDVMLEIPVYCVDRYIREDPADGIKYEYRWLAKDPIDGLRPDPMFVDGDTVLKKVYLALFLCSAQEKGTMLCSRAGAAPLTEITRRELREAARRKGARWGISDVWTSFALQHLYLIMFANSNGKEVLGGGRTDMAFDGIMSVEESPEKNVVILSEKAAKKFLPGQQIAIGSDAGRHEIANDRTIISIDRNAEDQKTFRIAFDGEAVFVPKGSCVWSCPQRTGGTIEMASANGCTKAGTKYPCRFLYLEDWIGNIWEWIDGDNVRDNVHFLSHDFRSYAENLYTGTYQPLGYRCTNIEGYLKELGYDPACPMAALPIQVGGSAATYYCNSYFCSNSGDRGPLYGSSLRNGKYAGMFFWDVDDPAESRIWNVGGRLLFK